jgi:hypothetical protein
MDNNLQIITFIYSYFFGFIFFYLAKFNYVIIKNNNTIIKYLDNTLFILNIVLIYVILNYKINNGYFHIYFLITLTLGYISANYMQKFVKMTLYKLKKKK